MSERRSVREENARFLVTHLQNDPLPDSSSNAIECRVRQTLKRFETYEKQYGAAGVSARRDYAGCVEFGCSGKKQRGFDCSRFGSYPAALLRFGF